MKPAKTALPFASGFSFFKMFWIFIVFSLLGTAAEGIYWILRYGHFEMRSGLIYGPFCEIYGFAAVLLLLLLYRFKDKSIPFLFLSAYVTAALFEFLCSFLQEKAFGFTSWDYSNSKFAIFGRANLIYAIPWGFFGVFFVKNLYLKLSDLIEKIPKKIGVTLTWLLLLFMIFDFSISTAAVYRFNERQNNIPATNFIQAELDQHYPDAYLEEIYSRILKGRK